MKKIVLLGCLFLAGCATGVPSSGEVSAKVAEIQKYTKLACSFVPTVATVAAILSQGASSPFTSIAQDICTAVTTAPLADGGRRVAYVKGVPIKGSFVK